MGRTTRRAVFASRLGWGAFLVGLTASAALASEPDGNVRLRAEWVAADPPVIRLFLEPFIELDEATLMVSAPLDIVLRPTGPSENLEFAPAPPEPNRRVIRATLRPQAESIQQFEVRLPPHGFGVLEFILEGRTARGKTVRGALGIATGESPPVGTLRNGAMEFPAAVLPSGER